MHHPQTVRFEMRIQFKHVEREGPEEITLTMDDFDRMGQRFREERKRRRRGDRATSAQYRMHLTEHGRQVCAEDADRRDSHKDAIEGKWFDWYPRK